MKKLFYMLFYVYIIINVSACKKTKNTDPTAENIKEHIYNPDETSIFPNPERGWFYTIDPDFFANISSAPLTVAQLSTLKAQHNIVLVRKYYVLNAYKTISTLPAGVISELQNDLNVCRTAGFKLIPRFTYVWNLNFSATSHQDATLSITLAHINQLMPVLNTNIDVVDHLQAGFVGRWGEFHTSTNGHVLPQSLTLSNTGKIIIDSLLSGLSKKRMIAFRYPTFQQQIYGSSELTANSAYNESHQARSGFHNDGFAHDNTDFGTWNVPFGTNDPVRNYAKKFTRYTVMSGEPAGANFYSQTQTLDELKFYHYSSLSMNMPDAINNGFYDGLQAAGNKDIVSRKLGYRFVLVKSSFPKAATVNSTVPVKFSIHNTGWAACYNKKRVQMVFRDKTSSAEFKKELNADPRFWFSAATKDITDNLNLAGIPQGTYQLFLALQDPEGSISARPEYSIRFANIGLWEASTGYNSFKHDIVIN